MKVKCCRCGKEKSIASHPFGMNMTGGFDVDGWEFSEWAAARGENITFATAFCPDCQRAIEEKRKSNVKKAKAAGCETDLEIEIFILDQELNEILRR